jgi:hypothetical protein
MDAIFRAPPPHPLIIAGAIGSGLIGGFVFYNRPRQVGRRFTYLLAGIVGLAAFNSWLLDMAPADFLRFAQTIVNQRRMLFYTQEITLIAIVLLTPVHRALAPLHLLPERSWPAWINNLYGWLRLLLASAFVTMTTIYFTTRWLALEPQPKVATFYPINLPGNLTEMSIFTAVALAGALTIAAILYWPPPFRRVQWRFGFIRLLLLITGIVLIGFLYRTPINAQAILVTLQYTGALMLLGLPIQRSLS